jgi:hypothetical protein
MKAFLAVQTVKLYRVHIPSCSNDERMPEETERPETMAVDLHVGGVCGGWDVALHITGVLKKVSYCIANH